MQQESAYIMPTSLPGDLIKETERLKQQGYAITQALKKDLIPHLNPGDLYIDLGSGAGELVRMVAQENTDADAIGVDVLPNMVQYSNDQARVQKRSNAHFCVMNILTPLDFEDGTADYINMRFLFGVVKRDYWPTLLHECYRVLKPGGKIIMTEPATTLLEEAPFCHQLAIPMMRAIYQTKNSFSEYEVGIAPAIPRLLRQGGYVGIQTNAYFLDCSAGAPLHDKIVQDYTEIFNGLKPLMLKHGNISEQALDAIIAGATDELHQDDFSAMWGLILSTATKPIGESIN